MREKYSSYKGISSDMVYGTDDESAIEIKSKLEKLNNSTSISSDMLYGESSMNNSRGQSSDDISDGISKLKDSVKGFFDDIQRRIG